MDNALRTYLQSIDREYKTGIAVEHAYRPALKQLLEAVENGLNAVNDPKRSDIGAPDFQVLRGHTTIGFVEAKDINVPLNKVEKSEQMQRYLSGFGNLILTDYVEFRWYVKGQQQQKVRIADVNGHIRADKSQFDALAQMLRSFVQVIVPTIKTPKELAQRMAGNAHLIRNLIINDLESDDPSANLTAQRDAFARTLLPDIDNAQFADMYAQTISYGLFASRVNYTGNPEQFSRRGAGEDIPSTNPFLRKLFSNIGLDLGDRVTFLVDVLVDLLAHTDMHEILKDFGRATLQEDPVVHFYETFLREYDPKLREQRGVYYTPEPVVGYIVRSVDHILRERFGRTDGLADTDTLILDPATGTGTFLYFVMRQIYDTGFAGQAGIWNSYVQEHLLRRIFGFELLMAPYAVAHMKLGLLLDELGYTFASNQRLGVYLTNTLEEAATSSETLFAQFISEEANEASAIKREKPIMVVLGNPPYSNFGQLNQGDWILELLEDYKKGLDERKLNLDDDYIKFLRFGQWRIEQTGQGILAFVTNHSFLSGITHRRMRESLRETFTDIYILDLHGNTRLKESPPDNVSDKNVFDIQQGVAITILVKQPGKKGPGKVHHADLWGTRAHKYTWLSENSVSTTNWQELVNVDQESCLGAFYFFTPRAFENIDEYCVGWSVRNVYLTHQNGLKTDRDPLFFDFDREVLKRRMQVFYSPKALSSPFKEEFRVESSSSYDLLSRREKTRFSDNNLRQCAYRPFDMRWLYYDPDLTSRPAFAVMRHMLAGDNVAFICLRQSRRDEQGTFFVASGLINKDAVSSYDIGTVFPLYLYPDPNEGQLFANNDDGSAWPLSERGRRPNLNPQFVQEMAHKLGLQFVTDGSGDLKTTFGPEDVFAYAYAILHIPEYRERYAEFLKIEFPRLPLINNIDVFWALAARGAALVDLHLMRSPDLGHLVTTYPAKGDNRVLSPYPKYTNADQRVWISTEQYFEGIPEEVWKFQVGGYQVLDKWLKDRRGLALNYDDIRHYQRVIVALQETIRLMNEIEVLFPSWPPD